MQVECLYMEDDYIEPLGQAKVVLSYQQNTEDMLMDGTLDDL